MKGEVVLLFEFLASKPRALVLAQWFSMELILAKLLCINSLIFKTMFTSPFYSTTSIPNLKANQAE